MSMERWSFPLNFKNSSNRWLGEHPLNSPQKQKTDSKTSFWLSLIVGWRLKSVAVRWSLLGPDNGEANDDIYLPSNDDILGIIWSHGHVMTYMGIIWSHGHVMTYIGIMMTSLFHLMMTYMGIIWSHGHVMTYMGIMMTSIFHLMMTYMGLKTMGFQESWVGLCVCGHHHWLQWASQLSGSRVFQGGGSNNKKANIRKWGVISRHWVPVTGNPELWTHNVLQGGKDVLKSLKMSEEAFNATEYRLVFLTSVLLSGASYCWCRCHFDWWSINDWSSISAHFALCPWCQPVALSDNRWQQSWIILPFGLHWSWFSVAPGRASKSTFKED